MHATTELHANPVARLATEEFLRELGGVSLIPERRGRYSPEGVMLSSSIQSVFSVSLRGEAGSFKCTAVSKEPALSFIGDLTLTMSLDDINEFLKTGFVTLIAIGLRSKLLSPFSEIR